MDNETIKKKFLELRREKGLSWEDLTEKAGVKSYRNILNVLNSSGLTLKTLEKLSALVGCEPWELLKPDQEHDNQKQTQKPANTITCPHCKKTIFLNPSTKQ